jgi:signal transduction histidine kinase
MRRLVVGADTVRELVQRRFRNITLSQKINLIFAGYFFVTTLRYLIDHGTLDTPYRIASSVGVVFLLLLAFFDNLLVRILQVGGLIVLGFLLILNYGDPSNGTAFAIISIALAAAYKMDLLGRQARSILLSIILITLVIALISGAIHQFSLMRRLNMVAFVLAFTALLYVIFEEETINLRRQRDTLSRHAAELHPFAELGNNTAGLVHDFKGDVAGLYAIAAIERLSDNAEAAERIQSYADRINTRVEAILDVATAVDRHETELLQLPQLLQNVVYYFVEVNRDLKHKVRISLEVEPELALVGRRNALMVILENVIKNSIEATADTTERAVRIRALRNGHDTVVIEISHNGRSLVQLERETDPIDVRGSNLFQRGHSTKPDGSGLGMLNVIRALEVMNGEMTMVNLPRGVLCRAVFPAS